MKNGLIPAIIGLEGAILSEREQELLKDFPPVGYILFARNCIEPQQLSELIASLHALHSHYTPLILIDQEGGRVARLKQPHWQTFPAPGLFAEMAIQDKQAACRAAYENSAAIAKQLLAHGINVNCTPMCDIRFPFSHNIIGDRAYGEEPEQIIMLAREVANGLMDHGVLPVLKHLPGHGRALVDSHESLPIVDTDLDILEHTDFIPFKALNDLPLGMTAHIRYTAIDASLPATLSPTVIRIIRENIGFTNLLMSDDLCMKALQGSMEELTAQTLEAGCDFALHCNGDYEEVTQVLKVAARYPAFTLDRLNQLYARLPA